MICSKCGKEAKGGSAKFGKGGFAPFKCFACMTAVESTFGVAPKTPPKFNVYDLAEKPGLTPAGDADDPQIKAEIDALWNKYTKTGKASFFSTPLNPNGTVWKKFDALSEAHAAMAKLPKGPISPNPLSRFVPAPQLPENLSDCFKGSDDPFVIS